MASKPVDQTGSRTLLQLPYSALIAALAIVFLWAYWMPLRSMAERWQHDQHYQHGFLVPLFSLGLLYLRRARIAGARLLPTWWGLALLILGIALRLADAFFYVDWFDSLSLLPVLAGLTLLLGGWPALAWAWPAIAFLFFMMPLPYFVDTAMAFPLRKVATVATTYVVQTLGFPAVREGTTIVLSGTEPVDVAPACSGMGMLLTLYALAAAFVLVVDRPWLDKIIILLSAGPIAIVSNILRITITAVLFEMSADVRLRAWFHDWAGLLMMPVGLALLGLELRILDRLLIPKEIVSHKSMFDFSQPSPFRRAPRVQGKV